MANKFEPVCQNADVVSRDEVQLNYFATRWNTGRRIFTRTYYEYNGQ